MRKIYMIWMLVLTGMIAYSQEYNEKVNEVIGDVNLDSLIYQLRNLSGEDSVVVGGELTIIEHRVSNWGNDLAAQYIFETLEGLGLEPYYQDYSTEGRNVIAVQEGTEYPDQYYMICAHYDSKAYHCADDNGSGTAGVLEAARVFSALGFEYSIIYALWDQEELGLLGSNYYANQAYNNGDDILDVINMDMIGWDSDEDMNVEIHSSYSADSDLLSDYIVSINDLYGLQTVPVVEIPGTGASDQGSFWSKGYPAVLLIEEYYNGDFNDYYHTDLDRIDVLNMDFFHETAKLAIGSLASLATPATGTFINELASWNGLSVAVSPNPVRDGGSITYTTASEGSAELTLLNSQGVVVRNLGSGVQQAGKHEFKMEAGDLPQGLYFIQLRANGSVALNKMIIQ